MRHIFPAIAFFLLVLLFFWSLEEKPAPTTTTPSTLKVAPVLDVLPLPGTETALPLAMAGGKPVLLNFFASWCTPCLGEHPLIKKLGERDDLFLYGIGWSDKLENIAAWLAKHGNPYDHAALDNAGHTGIAYGITGVPESFLIDRSGAILFHQQGPLTKEVIDAEILPRLEASDAKP